MAELSPETIEAAQQIERLCRIILRDHEKRRGFNGREIMEWCRSCNVEWPCSSARAALAAIAQGGVSVPQDAGERA